MNKKVKTILLIAVSVVLVAAATVAAVLLIGRQGESAAPEQTVKLYWNVEQEQFEDPASGMSLRNKNENDEYLILFAWDGIQERLRCKEQELVDKIDANKIVGLTVTDDLLITQVYTLEELNFNKAVWKFYIRSIDEDGVITAYSDKAMTGEQQQVTLNDDVQIYQAVGADLLTGMVTDVREYDRVMGVTDEQGNLTHLYVIERVYTGSGEMRYCAHCKEEVKWWSWDNTTTLPAIDGHFYLTNDVQLTKQALVRENIKIVLDLQGHVVNGKLNNRVFATWGEGAYLGIMDTSIEQTGKLVARGNRMDQGACLWIRYGEVELFSGTLDATEASTIKNGAGVLLKSGATFNMYGGEILGGTSEAVTNEAGKVSNGCGGNMYIEGTFNMHGGRIADGKSVGVITGNTASMGIGGNLYVTKTGVVNISGNSVIDGGKTTGPGANIYTNGQINIKGNDVQILGGTVEGPGKNGGSIYITDLGSLFMEGGLISGGSALNGSGGNICNYGTLNIVGATIKEGSAAKNADSIYGVGGVMHIEDSTITNCLRVGKNVDFSLGGTVDIQELELPYEALVNVDALKADSKIVITASGFFTEKTENDCAGCFKPNGFSGSTINYGGRFTIGFYRCICGQKEHASWCDGKSHLWKTWAEKASLPSKDNYFYLIGDVKLTNQCVIRAGQKVTIDLRGRSIIGKNNLRIFATWGEGAYLGLVDSSKDQTGKLVASGEKLDQGGCLWIRFGTVDLYSGTLDASKAQTLKNGGAVLLKEGATLNMYGGTIIGGTSQAIKSEADKPINGSGGNLYIEGQFNMYDGVISDGKAIGLYDGDSCLMGTGGNLYVTKTGVANLVGGVLKNGVSSSGGGNIYMAGEVHVGENVQILDGIAEAPLKSGGSINVHELGKLYITGGLVSGGTSTNLGGVISCNGQVFISGGTVSGGTAGSASSNNIVVLKNATLTLSGGTVDGAIRQAAGANVILKDNPVVTGTGISSADGTLLTIEGTLGENANIVIPMEKDICYFAQTDISENTAAFVETEGFEVAFDAEKNQLYYRSLEVASDHAHENDPTDVKWTQWDGSAFVDGGYYYLPEGGLTLESRATVNGINVTLCLNGQTLTGKPANRTFFILNGGELTICDCSEYETGKIVAQGTNKENGGNIMVGSKSTLNLQGGTICGGSVKDGMFGGNINVVGNASGNGVLNMTGGCITGGNADVNAGGNVYVSGTLNISGGQIDGFVSVAKGTLSQVNISGKAQILGEENGLYLPTNELININGLLEQTAKIYIVLESGSGVFTQSTSENNLQAFESGDKAYTVIHNGTALEVISKEEGEDPEGPGGTDTPSGHEHCFCNQQLYHEHVNAGWTIWDGDGQKLQKGGYYVIDEDLTLSDTVVLGTAGQTAQKSVDVYLCLNGMAITAPQNKQAFQINGGYTLHICDCSSEKIGMIRGNGKFTGSGGLIAIAEKGTLMQYGGIITDGCSSGNGANIAVTANATYTIYGGKVVSGVSNNLGGNISVSAGAVFTMHGGEISGGSAKTTNCNNIIMAAAGTMDLHGGYIQGGVRATNGTVKLSGTIRITDGTASNLSVNKNSIIKINGQLTGTKQVGVSGVTVFATGVAEDVSAFFFADTAGKSVAYDQEKKELKLV